MEGNDRKQSLEERRAPLEMSGPEFREAGHRLVDAIASFLDSIRDRPVTLDESPSQIRACLPKEGLPERGADARLILDDALQLLTEHSLLSGHPRFLGYIVGSAAPIGALADLLAAAVNPNLGGWQLSPVASEIERQAVCWLAELIGYPVSCGGLFVSGGNMANFTGFLAARRAKGSSDVRERGLSGQDGRLLVYATRETHTWIQKAMDLFGHGTDALVEIPVDERQRADVTGLRHRLEADRARGDRPFLLIGTAGTVSTGAIDPIREMSAIAREHDLWLHVDGAYGALAAAVPDAVADLRALAEADSIAVDPHKWMYAPAEAGCTLVRDPQALPDAFSFRPPYYHFEEDDDPRINFYEYGLQNSRGFRALKVWLSLRQAGRSGFAEMIGDDISLAEELFEILDARNDFEAVSQSLSITTFRYVPEGLERAAGSREAYLNELNEALLTQIKQSGELFVSNALIGEKFVLRSCIVNFRTSLQDMRALPEIVSRHGQKLHAELSRR